MKLHLLNDLPLIGDCADEPRLDAVLIDYLAGLAPRLPAELTYVGFDEFEGLWSRTARGARGLRVHIGTRPPRLHARTQFLGGHDATVAVRTRRVLGPTGHTQAVDLTDPFDPERDPPSAVTLLDDVMMSGTTVAAVLALVGKRAPHATVLVRTVMASAHALHTVREAFPDVDVATEVVLRGAPINEQTAIFLSDLLYGALHGMPFLEATELLRPFFGTDLSSLYRLREELCDGALWRPHDSEVAIG